MVGVAAAPGTGDFGPPAGRPFPPIDVNIVGIAKQRSKSHIIYKTKNLSSSIQIDTHFFPYREKTFGALKRELLPRTILVARYEKRFAS
jgi:hypothetical protein